MRVGIIGLGVIGKAQARMFRDHDLVTYDPAQDDDYPYEALDRCEFAVVCVGTPPLPDGHADLSYLCDAVSALPQGLPVLLRSTVPPTTTDHLFDGSALFCHAPEFTGENPAHPWQECSDVPYLILGGSAESRAFFRPRLARVFPGTIHECSALESELTKYTANLYWATRVTFVNELALICQQFGADWENVREAWLQDPRVTSSYTKRARFSPGFGGRCWPKDLSALIAASRDAGYYPEFLDCVHMANERFCV